MDTITALSIIVGVDGSPSSRDALICAAEIAKAFGAPLRAVTTWEFPAMLEAGYLIEGWSPEGDAREILSATIDEAFRGDVPAALTQVTAEGSTAAVLIDESSRAQMLVVGSRGHGGFAGLLLGSVSSACATHARCPVLIMHGSAPTR